MAKFDFTDTPTVNLGVDGDGAFNASVTIDSTNDGNLLTETENGLLVLLPDPEDPANTCLRLTGITDTDPADQDAPLEYLYNVNEINPADGSETTVSTRKIQVPKPAPFPEIPTEDCLRFVSMVDPDPADQDTPYEVTYNIVSIDPADASETVIGQRKIDVKKHIDLARNVDHDVQPFFTDQYLQCAISARSFTSIFTNRMRGGFNNGVRNTNGTLGAFSVDGDNGGVAPVEILENFGRYGVDTDNPANQGPSGFVFPAANSVPLGTLVWLDVFGVAEEVTITGGPFRGAEMRDADGNLMAETAVNSFIARPTESKIMRSDGTSWATIGDTVHLGTPGSWLEERDGTYTAWRTDINTIAPSTPRTVNLPQPVTNLNYAVALTVKDAAGLVEYSPTIINKTLTTFQIKNDNTFPIDVDVTITGAQM